MNKATGYKRCKAVTLGKKVNKGETANCWLKTEDKPVIGSNETAFLILD